jgi:putative ABC transport system substrate-binding protein
VIDRRAFLGGAAAGIIAVPGAARAQLAGKVYRVGCLFLRDGPSAVDEAFRQALRELGYVERRNLAIEYRWAAGKEERLPEMAMELVRLKVDIIVGAANPPISAAKRATSTIPIVMAVVSDPVDTGLVSSLAHPGGNVTGLTLMTAELSGKRLQLMRELVPQATRIGVLTRFAGTPVPFFLERMRSAAQQLGVQLLVQDVNEAENLPGAFAALQRERAQALIVPVSPFITIHITRVLELAAQHRLPTMYETRRFVEAGGLVSYGPNTVEMYRRAALYVDRILKGANPGDLPIEQPTKFEFIMNLKTAKALGITIPQSVLLRADEVLQ